MGCVPSEVQKPDSKVIKAISIKKGQAQSYDTGKVVFSQQKTRMQEGGPSQEQLKKDLSRQNRDGDDSNQIARVTFHDYDLEYLTNFMEPWICMGDNAPDGCQNGESVFQPGMQPELWSSQQGVFYVCPKCVDHYKEP